jgi:predicted metal-dependent phosphoesterase TrpH
LGEPSKGSVPDIPDLDSGPITISVIVCAHNERQWLPACLHSVLAQSRPPDQLIADVRSEAKRAMDKYGMLVIPGAEITQNRLNGKKNSHVIALDIRNYISADQRADDILREIRKQDAISIACHPHHRTTRRIEISTCYLWDNRKTLGELVDLWEAANRDDLFSVTSLKHYPYVANSDFHKPKHLFSWKALVKSEKNWPAIKTALRRNVDIALTLFRKGDWAV